MNIFASCKISSKPKFQPMGYVMFLVKAAHHLGLKETAALPSAATNAARTSQGPTGRIAKFWESRCFAVLIV